jgi:hypothetical protein
VPTLVPTAPTDGAKTAATATRATGPEQASEVTEAPAADTPLVKKEVAGSAGATGQSREGELPTPEQTDEDEPTGAVVSLGATAEDVAVAEDGAPGTAVEDEDDAPTEAAEGVTMPVPESDVPQGSETAAAPQDTTTPHAAEAGERESDAGPQGGSGAEAGGEEAGEDPGAPDGAGMQSAQGTPEATQQSTPQPTTVGQPTDAATAESDVATGAPEQGDLASAPPSKDERIPETGLGALQSGALGAVLLLALVVVRRLRHGAS